MPHVGHGLARSDRVTHAPRGTPPGTRATSSSYDAPMARARTKQSALGHLEDARAAIVAERFAAARDALVEAWRVRRSPALAALVELVAERAPDELATSLASALASRVGPTLERVIALRGIDDPRVSGFALATLGRMPFAAASSADLLRELLDRVTALRDPRLCDHRQTIAISVRMQRMPVRTDLHRRLERAVAGVRDLVTEPSAAEATLEAELDRRLDRLRSPARTAASLVAEVYAEPDDDAPRLVLADLLLERGDPVGELIALQLERGDRKPSKREHELLAKHGRGWLGTLAPILGWRRPSSRTEIRRGFLAVADIIRSVKKQLIQVREDPAWATVEELLGSWDRELLLVAPFRALRFIERPLDSRMIATLATRAEPLGRVGRVWVSDPQDIDPELLRAAFPGLETVAMYRNVEGSQDLGALGALGVEHVAITHNHFTGSAAAAGRAFRGFVDGLVGTAAPMARLTLEAPRGEPVELRRDARGMFRR